MGETITKLLEQIKSGKSPGPRRILVYGEHGVGKSTFAAGAPKCVFVPTEEGQDDIDCNRFPLATEFDQVIKAISELASEKHDFGSVAIDSADWLEQLIFRQVCKDKRVDSIEDIGYGKGYVYALAYWREILDGLAYLRSSIGMTVILIAHAQVKKFSDPATDSYDRYMPRLHDRSSHLIQEWVDEVLFARFKVLTTTVDEGFGRTKTRGIGDGERIVLTTPRPSHVAKNRIDGLPPEIPFTWEAFSQYVNTDTKKKGTK